MFIKKDLRKIPDILNDAEDERKELLVGRRWGEFGGTVTHLVKEKNLPKLDKLVTLSLYQNGLTTVEVCMLLQPCFHAWRYRGLACSNP